MAEEEDPENYGDEKLLALAIADIKAKRGAFYEAGEPFTLSKEDFERQWQAVDGWYTLSSRKGCKTYYNCRLNQTRNLSIALKKPGDYVNPSGRELSFQKHYQCNSSLTVEQLPNNEVKIQVVRGHSDHTMSDSDTHKKSTVVVKKVQDFGREGFPAALIKSTLVDKARSPEEAEATGMSKVTTKDVNNWIRGLAPSDSREFGVTNKNQALTEILLHMDVADARAYLTNQGYKHDLIRCPPGPDGKVRWVLVFADNQQLLDLENMDMLSSLMGLPVSTNGLLPCHPSWCKVLLVSGSLLHT